ncbi:hypothetical protein MASR1M90_21770 [Desulfovibrionales bacterium]
MFIKPGVAALLEKVDIQVSESTTNFHGSLLLMIMAIHTRQAGMLATVTRLSARSVKKSAAYAAL